MPDYPSRTNSEYELLPIWCGKSAPKPCGAWLWFLTSCVLSMGIYLVVFSHLTFPYSIDIYERMLETKRSHFAQSSSPRLLLIAGSNARVSHSAKVIEEELGIPVTNGGLSAAVSTDFILESYKPVLKYGDFCYLPLEYEPLLEYTRSQHLDYKFAIACDRSRLAGYDIGDQLEAAFGYELSDVFKSLGEQVVVHQMKASSSREEIDEQGDQLSYDMEKAERFREALETMEGPLIPGPEVMRSHPEMLVELGEFLDWCSAQGVMAIGGLPTTFDDVELPPELIDGLREFYESRGHAFVVLANHSLYPREQFYDSKYHLLQEHAFEHSRRLAAALKPIIDSDNKEDHK